MSDLDPILQADEVIRREAPSLWEALSPLGRRLKQPANFLPLQSAEARGKPFNATIGQITDGRGKAVPLPAMAAALANLDPQEASQSFLYSPVEGLAPLRRAFREFQRRGLRGSRPSTLPLVTDGFFHARGLALQMVVPAGRTVFALDLDPDPSLRDLVEGRLGGRLVELAGSDSAAFAALGSELARLPEGEPAVVLADIGEAPEEAEILLGLAVERPLVVVVDDRAEGLAGPCSLFWSLTGRSERLVPIKLDGTEGSWDFAGGRVGFVTFGYPEEGPLAKALESKMKMLLRAEVGSPSAFAQVQFLKMLEAHAAA